MPRRSTARRLLPFLARSRSQPSYKGLTVSTRKFAGSALYWSCYLCAWLVNHQECSGFFRCMPFSGVRPGLKAFAASAESILGFTPPIFRHRWMPVLFLPGQLRKSGFVRFLPTWSPLYLLPLLSIHLAISSPVRTPIKITIAFIITSSTSFRFYMPLWRT